MAITAEEQTSIVQLVVGMAGVAPRPEDLADLVAEFEAGSSLVQIAQNIVDHPAYSGDTGLFPNYLPNSVWATQYLTMLVGADVSAEDLAAAIAATTADLNAGSTRAEVAVATINALAAETPAAGYEDAAATLANQTTVAEYYATTSVEVDANIAAMTAAISDVDSTAASVTAGIAAVDAALPVIPFDLTEGFAGIAAAEAAIAAFLTAESTTAGAIAAAPAAAKAVYDPLVTDSDVGVDSAALQAALLSDQVTANAGVLTAANTALSDASGDADDVAGLTTAVATAAAALSADTAADVTATATQVALDAAEASWEVSGAASGDVTSVANAAGVLNATMDAGSAFGNVVIPLTTATGGVASLKAETAAWTSAQKSLFAAMQATAGVAEVIAANNADVAADNAATATQTALDAADYTVGFLDILATAEDELADVGAGFTEVTPAAAATPTEAEITAEQAALVGVEATAAILAAADVAADGVAGLAVTAAAQPVIDAVAAADIAVLAVGGTIATGTLVVAADGSAVADLGSGVVDLLDNNAGTIEIASGLTADAGGLIAALIAAAQTREDADAAKVITAAAVVTSAGVESDAEDAITDFQDLIDLLDGANTSNPLTDPLAGLISDVSDAQDDIDDLADANADVASADVDVAALAVLTGALSDANDAFTDEGYAVPNDVDSVVEFGTAVDDIFAAGTIDSSIYNFSLQGDDTLFVGTTATVNSTEIGSGTGQTDLEDAGDVLALEIFLVDTGTDVDVIIETQNYGSETGDYTTITLVGVASVDDVTIADGFVTVA